MNFSIGNLVSSVVGAVAKVANAIGSVFSNPAEAVNGAIADIANITADGKIDEDEEEEFLEDILKLYVGASILNIKNEMSNIDDILNNTITNFNNIITVLNKSAVLITSAEAAKYLSLKDKLSNLWNDFFMPADLPGELNATKMLDNPVLKGIGDVGGKLGLVGTVLNPVVEYNNSLKPYKDDIDAAYEIDPQNAWKYNCEMHVAAGADAASFGYARAVLNTIPVLVQLAPSDVAPEWTNSWINNVNYCVNSRNLVNEIDKAVKDPVKGPIIEQFLR